MKRLFVLFFCFSTITLYAQNLKTYKGKMYGEVGEGDYSYSYYQNSDGKELRHGIYKYSEKVKNDGGTYSATFTGNYKNDYRDGIWTYVIEKIDYPERMSKRYLTSTLRVTMSFSEGVPNGAWTYTFNAKYRLRRYHSLYNWSWDTYQTIKDISFFQKYEVYEVGTVNVIFKNGKLIGSVKIKTENTDITGQIGNNGFFYGKWLYGNGNEETYENGILQSTYDKELNKLQQEFVNLPLEKRDDFLFQHRLKLDTMGGVYLKDYFDMPALQDREIKGIVKDAYGNSYDNGKYIKIERRTLRPLEYVIGENRDINPKRASSNELERYLEKCKIELSDEDVKKFENIIREKQKEEQKAQVEDYYKKRYDTLYNQLNELMKLKWPDCPKQENQGEKTNKEIDNMLNSFVATVWHIYPISRYFEGKYKLSDFSTYGYNPNYKHDKYNYVPFNPIVSNKESFEKLNEHVDFIKTRLKNRDSINHLICLSTEIKINVYRVERAYIKNPAEMGTEGWTFHRKKVSKQDLYNPYYETLKYLINNVKGNSSFVDLYNYVNSVNNLCLFMIDNSKMKTKEIEKELKATDKVEDWIRVFSKYTQR